MDQNAQQLIALAIKDIAAPLIMSIVRAHMNATGGQLPTEEQVIAALPADAKRFDAIGQAFLAQTKPAA
jgi:hypothetical protein